MPSSLAKALIEAGVQHFDTGGTTQGGIGGFFTPQNTYRATAPTISTQDFGPGILNAENESEDVNRQQQSLGQTLLAQSQGLGPSPAQAMLNQETGKNVAATQALIAGARGSSANPGLIARLGAQQGANIEQQAVGQGATLKAQEQLASEGLLGTTTQNQAANDLQEQQIQQSALAAQNAAQTTGQLGATEANAAIATANANNAAATSGGLLGSLGSALTLGLHFADGGIVSYATPTDPRVVLNVPKGVNEFEGVQNALKAIPSGKGAASNPFSTSEIGDTYGSLGEAGNLAGGAGEAVEAAAPLAMLASHGGAVPINMKAGGYIPGHARVHGDSPENDIVPALLSPQEEVLPRSVTMAPDAPQRAKKFVEALQEKEAGSKNYGKVLKARATLKDRVARLEKLCAGGMA